MFYCGNLGLPRLCLTESHATLVLDILEDLRVARLWAPPATQHTRPFCPFSGSLICPFERTTICTCYRCFRYFSKGIKYFRCVGSFFCSYPKSHFPFFLYAPRGPFKTIVILLQMDKVAGNWIKKKFLFDSTRERELGYYHENTTS